MPPPRRRGSRRRAHGRPRGARRGAAPLPGDGLRVLLVDHQDSFVHTLAGYFREQGAEVLTLRAGLPLTALDEFAPDLVVLSPGPGRPADFACAQLLDQLDLRGLPAFGVCLGLQAMVEHAGGELALLSEPVHGKPGTVLADPAGGRPAGGPPGRVHRRPLPLAARGTASRSRAGSR